MSEPEARSHDNHRGRACQLCGATRALTSASLVSPALTELIRGEAGRWDEHGWICHNDLERFRYRYVENLLREEKGELGELEREVLQSLTQHELLAGNPQLLFDQKLTLGQRMADRIADFGGSWTFILIFAAVIIGWMALNSMALLSRPFDPFPYILLNLVLSCLAALQAPIIMMSQNRQEARDRAQATHDYQVNLKAELEIRQLHQKIDHLLSHQWERLVAIQEIQLELIGELRARK